ncbi:DegV family protein [Ornithinibacillus halotolerans]|uniref:Alanine aminotransferase n=1 Tax=Ornithinibacillus halotolerans TaxID=1274357 RepID=A0A916WEC3_9BACI|nr:DegV family protein [Ornithinibacillus halotolerans]GGA92743.1 alanine aminotransferase [Ornithinibacillus halotolerans]
MSIQLMTDGGADIPQELLNTVDIQIIPLYLNFKDQQYKSGVDLDLEGFNKKIKETKELPRSAAPSPNDFYKGYKKIEASKEILMISLSGGLSSTYENAIAGKNMLLEEEPNRKIEVINAKTASGGQALLLFEAFKKIQENYSLDEIADHLQKMVKQTATLFVLRTLENLVLGGRVDKVKGTIAKTLNIKLLMKASEEGTIEVAEKVRGDKKSIRRFVDQIGDYVKSVEDKILVMTHCNAKERANSVLNEIKAKYPFKETFVTEMGPLISTYGGDGALVIAFFKD